ncbi:MAG: hypothetical protein CVT83_00135 [Alphaproteobacteria bacterium HGW-Alphaproteobacteria-5]|nr:MAG: hypothetical protein CVT83_00135 [Alphaproteobacteria bacterium HGW-Alphaproteobacteria-5]
MDPGNKSRGDIFFLSFAKNRQRCPYCLAIAARTLARSAFPCAASRFDPGISKMTFDIRPG